MEERSEKKSLDKQLQSLAEKRELMQREKDAKQRELVLLNREVTLEKSQKGVKSYQAKTDKSFQSIKKLEETEIAGKITRAQLEIFER